MISTRISSIVICAFLVTGLAGSSADSKTTVRLPITKRALEHLDQITQAPTPAEFLAGTTEFLNILGTALSGEPVVDPCVPASTGDQIGCGSTIIGDTAAQQLDRARLKSDACTVAATCLVKRAKELLGLWRHTTPSDVSRFGPTTAKGLLKARRPVSDPTTKAALNDVIKLTKDGLSWVKKYQSCKSTASSAAKCTPASLDSEGTDLTMRLNDEVSRAANSYLFWPNPIPYARSPYVEDPFTHKPAPFRDDFTVPGSGYDGQFISEAHPAMYLQHAGNYGDKPGCPSCLVNDGTSGVQSCAASGPVCKSVAGVGGDEECCRGLAINGQCADNSPPPDCLQDPYGNVTQAGIDEAKIYYGNISKGLKLFDDSLLPVQLAFYDGTSNSGPQNFEEWQKVFGFDVTPDGDCRKPNQGETIRAWGVRCGCVWYYNKMELQLGRFICCAEFADRIDDGTTYGTPGPGSPDNGVACMTGNFGKDFDQPKGGMMGSLEFKDNQNFVNVTTRPAMHGHFRTQWWAFKGMTLSQDANGVWSYGTITVGEPPGKRLNQVLLDRARVRPIPLSCTNCHGGVYAPNDSCATAVKANITDDPNPVVPQFFRGDADCGQVDGNCSFPKEAPDTPDGIPGTCIDKHMVADTKFLPINPWTVGFADDPGFALPGLDPTQTRAGQQQRLRKINLLMTKRPFEYDDPQDFKGNGLTGGFGSDQLSGIQLQWLKKLYADDLDPTHAVAPKADTTPDPWLVPGTNFATNRDLWNKVVLPGCANCHMAVKPQRPGTCGCGSDNTKPFTVASYDQFVNYDAHGSICKKEFHMPHAAPTQEWFWSKQPIPIQIGGTSYMTPRAAFFGAILAADCPLGVPLDEPDQVEKPLLPIFGSYDGDGCAELELFTGCNGQICFQSSRLNPEPSDNYCGLTEDVPGTTPPGITKGVNGMICDDSLVTQGICVLGCRLADPRTGVTINPAIPFRGCPPPPPQKPQFECRADDRCHVCGSIGEATCTTGQLGPGPCPISGVPSGTQCIQ